MARVGDRRALDTGRGIEASAKASAVPTGLGSCLAVYPGLTSRGYCMPPLTGLECVGYFCVLVIQFVIAVRIPPGAEARRYLGPVRGAGAPLFHGIPIVRGGGEGITRSILGGSSLTFYGAAKAAPFQRKRSSLSQR